MNFIFSLLSNPFKKEDSNFYSAFNWEELGDNRGNKRPIMVIMHKSTCPACIEFKSWFCNSSDIQYLSQNLKMVNYADEKADSVQFFKNEPTYVPRIYFLSPSAKLLKDIKNQKEPEYCYYYPESETLIENMKKVLSEFKR